MITQAIVPSYYLAAAIMKNPFYLDPAVYKTVDGQGLEAYVQVPFASDTVPFGTKLPVGTTLFSLRSRYGRAF